MTKKEAQLKSKTDRHNSNKKYFAKVSDKTVRVDLKPLVNILAELLQISTVEANDEIVNGDVSVNSNLVVDPAFVLKSGDVVRAEMSGHYINGSKFICVIK